VYTLVLTAFRLEAVPPETAKSPKATPVTGSLNVAVAVNGVAEEMVVVEEESTTEGFCVSAPCGMTRVLAAVLGLLAVSCAAFAAIPMDVLVD